MKSRPALLAAVTLGRTKVSGGRYAVTPTHCACPACGTRYRLTSEMRRIYCGCGVTLLLDWARAA